MKAQRRYKRKLRSLATQKTHLIRELRVARALCRQLQARRATKPTKEALPAAC